MTINPLLDDIKSVLVTATLVTDAASSDWKINLGYLQDTPDRAVCVYETSGDAPETTVAVEYPDFQVRVRSKPDDYAAARAKMQEISTLLHGANIGGEYVFCFAKESGIIALGSDEKRRTHIVKNFRVMRNAP